MSKSVLSDATIRATKPINEKDVRLFDGSGLYLLIKPNDSRRVTVSVRKDFRPSMGR